MDFTYYLPGPNNTRIEYNTSSNSVIIIGANGSGKSKLGAWIEKNYAQNTHRIGAQRSLEFGTYIKQMSYEQATNKLISGSEEQTQSHDHRWKWDGEKWDYTSALLVDYESVLSAVWAKQTKQESEYIAKCRERDHLGQSHDAVPEMVVDKLSRIWSTVFPHRNIHFTDGKVTASFTLGENLVQYKGKDMSDGERVALYLMCQALGVPENKTVIIDEPELHLHRSIMNRLWSAIEQARQDCLFIYITHDTQFAANHQQSQKIWVKEFDGANWIFEKVEDSALPEQLLLDIMGNRRKVLFVEGTSDSYDTQLYTQLFKEYYVVPCGGCSKVIEQTKAMRANQQLHDLECYGLIDRDYRCDTEIDNLRRDGIYVLDVAEVENLFIVEELLQAINQIQGFADQSRIDAVETYIIDTRFSGEINKQIQSATISEIKYRLSTIDVSGQADEEIQNQLSRFFENFDYTSIKRPVEEAFTTAKATRDYKRVLRLFNRKSLMDSIGHYFGLTNQDYSNYVLRQLNGPNAAIIKAAIDSYLPVEIPH